MGRGKGSAARIFRVQVAWDGEDWPDPSGACAHRGWGSGLRPRLEDLRPVWTMHSRRVRGRGVTRRGVSALGFAWLVKTGQVPGQQATQAEEHIRVVERAHKKGH